MRNAVKLLAWLVAIALLLAVGVAAQAQTGDLDVVQLRPNFYVIGGAGGNIVVQIGPEGVILVDSGSTEMADKVLAAIRRLTPLPIRYIINTSMDADHVGGNEKLAKAGPEHPPGRRRGRRRVGRRPGHQLRRRQRAGARKRADADVGADGSAAPFPLGALADEDVRLPACTRCT